MMAGIGATNSEMNDVWSSHDGNKWDEIITNAPFSPRSYLQADVKDNNI